MPFRKNKTLLTILVAIPVACIIVGAFALSASAVMEDLRFVNAADQLLGVVASVRSIAAQQSGFAQTPGEDVFVDLAKAGQDIKDSNRVNPWQGAIRVTTVAGAAMRIETDVPTHECRRLGLYFMGKQPVELGVSVIEAQAVGMVSWVPIYPIDGAFPNADRLVGAACGKTKYARLAVVFRVK